MMLAPPRRAHADIKPQQAKLTPRERQVLNALARDLPYKGVADLLGCSRHTVKHHVSHLIAKLGVHSSRGAVAILSAGRMVADRQVF